MKLEWLTLKSDAANLDKVLCSVFLHDHSVHSSRHTPTDTFFTLQVLADIRADKDQANDGLSSALLILYLDSARNLPVGSIELTPVSAFLTWKLLLCSDTVYHLICVAAAERHKVAFTLHMCIFISNYYSLVTTR